MIEKMGKNEVIRDSNPKRWNKEEIDFLKENYNKICLDELSLKLKKSESSIRYKICNLGLIWIISGHNEKFRGKNGRFLKGHKFSEDIEIERGKSISKSLIGNKHLEITKKNVSATKIRLYKEGKIKLSGCAKLSKEGDFSKGENNPRFKYDKSNPPLCKCGCGKQTKFSYSLKRFSDYLQGHSSNGENNPMYGKSSELAPRWLGGKSFEPYTKEFNKKFKELIRQRDNFTCLKCNLFEEDAKRLYKKKLTCHHVDYNKKLTIKENCCSLCVRCNAEVNFNRPHWIKFFQSLLSERYGYKYSPEGEIILEVKNEI